MVRNERRERNRTGENTVEREVRRDRESIRRQQEDLTDDRR